MWYVVSAVDLVNPSDLNQSESSKDQNFPLKVTPYMHFLRRSGTPNHLARSGKYSLYLGSNLTNILFLALACRYAPTKSPCLTRRFMEVARARNILTVRMAVQALQVSSHSLDFCRSPLTTMRILSLSRVPSEFDLALGTGRVGTTCSPFRGFSMTKVSLFRRFIISERKDASHRSRSSGGCDRMALNDCGSGRKSDTG